MKKISSLIISSAFIFTTGLSLTSCSGSNSGDSLTIRILNLEDYIYLNDPKNGYTEEDMVDQFASYYKETYGKDIQVIYETSDTNESIYNDLLTGRTKYDLVCTSDYMLQKFVREGLITKLHKPNAEGEDDWLTNYHAYASPVIKERLDEIDVMMPDGTTEYLGNYCVGYMWGTLGILFNPSYSGFSKDADPLEDMASWGALWDSKYNNTISIKDSMRDTYAAALMYTYDEELNELRENYNILLNRIDTQYEEGAIDEEEYIALVQETANEYNSKVSVIFNRTDDETLKLVAASLEELKGNIFGMEVDSGKQDIVTGKIGVNLAYSGDAVYSIELAAKKDIDLYYSVPTNGANIWFDGWCIPTDDSRSEEQFHAAHEFLNFISDPEYAAKNMDYTGYTPYIGGDTIYEQVLDWYDARTDLIYFYDEKGEYDSDDDRYLSLYYFDEENDEDVEIWYEDCHYEAEADPEFDGVALYYYPNNDTTQKPIDYKIDGKQVYYNDLLVIDPEWEEVDLSYFFEGTLEEYDQALFYVDYYCEDNRAVGSDFFVQYPSEEVIIRCAVMDDYGDTQNIKVLKMWESFKSNALPVWAVIVLVSILLILGTGVTYYFVSNHLKKKLREKRLNEK